MEIIIFILLIVVNLVLILQDLFVRKVHVVPLIIHLLLSLLYAYQKNLDIDDLFVRASLNLSYLALLFLVLLILIKIKRKPVSVLFQEWIGIGDLIYLISVIPFFELRAYVFYVMICSLAGVFVGILIKKWKSVNSVPLVSVLGIVFLILVVLQETGKQILLSY